MFARYLTSSLHRMDYLCVPILIVIPIRCIYRHYLTLFRFLLLFESIWYSDVFDYFIVLAWLYHYYSFRLWSLVVYNSLRCHFDLSWGYFYLYLHTTLIYNNNIVLRSPDPSWDFVITSIWLPDFVPLRSQALSFAHRLDTLRSTALLRSFVVLARILSISLRSRSDLSLYTSDLVYRTPHSFTFIIRSFSDRILTLYHSLFWRHRNCLTRTSHF